jgi:hypothetical protein
MKKWFILTEKNLFAQKLFWLSILFPLFSFFYFGVFAWWGKNPVLSAHGYERFYEISKFPLLLLASSAPLGAIVNNIHRTIQTEKQIEEAKRKSLSDSYYSHFKHVVDYFTTLPPKKISLDVSYSNKFNQEFKISYPIHLYKFIYNKNSPDSGILNTNNLYMSKLSDTLISIVGELENITPPKCIKDSSLLQEAQSLNKIEDNIAQLHKMMCIDTPSQNYHFYHQNQSNEFLLRTNFGSSIELAARIELIYQYIINIYEITVYFDFNEQLKEDTGNLTKRLMLLRDIPSEIFRVIKYKSGVKAPTLVLDPRTKNPDTSA